MIFEVAHLAINEWMFDNDFKIERSWKKSLCKDIITAAMTYIVIKDFVLQSKIKLTELTFYFYTDMKDTFVMSFINLNLKHVMLNEITIYDSFKVIFKIAFVINEFFEI